MIWQAHVCRVLVAAAAVVWCLVGITRALEPPHNVSWGQDIFNVLQYGPVRCRHKIAVGVEAECSIPIAELNVDPTQCGMTTDEPCLISYNALWAPENEKINCGNCYNMSFRYHNGQSKHLVAQAALLHKNEVKFGMAPAVWEYVCPFVCRGTLNCVTDKHQCDNGWITEEEGGSCATPSADVLYQRVMCGTNSDLNKYQLMREGRWESAASSTSASTCSAAFILMGLAWAVV